MGVGCGLLKLCWVNFIGTYLLGFGGTEALFWSSSLGDVSAKPEELSASSICLARLLRLPAAFLDDLLTMRCKHVVVDVSAIRPKVSRA
jgi:hypothetical protein